MLNSGPKKKSDIFDWTFIATSNKIQLIYNLVKLKINFGIYYRKTRILF